MVVLFICQEWGIYPFKYVLNKTFKLFFAVDDTTFKNNAKRKEFDMEFLKEILGEDLFNQVAEKINAHNGNEANKNNQIKIGNLGKGEYVSKLKFDDKETELATKITELGEANKLIEQLKKDTKGNEELQGKITGYETQVADLQAQLQETKIKSAIKVGLLEAGCEDIDYVTYKLMESLKEKGENLELDENENIKGWNDKLSGLQTQLPTQFKSASAGDDGYKVLGENKLKQGDNKDVTPTKEDFLKMTYEERVALKQSNEQVYKKLAGKN